MKDCKFCSFPAVSLLVRELQLLIWELQLLILELQLLIWELQLLFLGAAVAYLGAAAAHKGAAAAYMMDKTKIIKAESEAELSNNNTQTCLLIFSFLAA